MTDTQRPMNVRIRMNHNRTAKDGWKLSETTVELDMESRAGSGIRAEMELALWSKLLHDAGTAEADRRNREDATL